MSSVDEMATLLRQWGLAPPYVEAFVAQDYTIESLKVLTKDQILKYIPKEGPRSIFEVNLQQLKESGNSEDTSISDEDEDDMSLAARRAKKRKLDNVQLQLVLNAPDKNSLHTALKKSMPGIIVLSFYEANSHLDEYSRSVLCTQVLYKELEDDFNRQFTRDDYDKIADAIVTLFPAEDKETWYSVVQKENSSTIQGRLRYRYYSLRRGLISSQLIQVPQPQAEAGVNGNLPDLGDDLQDPSFVWLCHNTSPWTEVRAKWEETRLRRLRFLALNKQLFSYFEKFPAIKENLGWELVAMDGVVEQPNLEVSLRELWSTYSKFLIKIIRHEKPSFLKGPKFASLSTEQQFVLIILELPNLWKIRTIPKSLESPKSKPCWRPSRPEIASGWVLHVREIAEIQEAINLKKTVLAKYHFQLQPIPVFVGPLTNLRQCFIVLDDVRWEFDGPFEAIEAAFKLSFGLGAKYPPEARHIWIYLQRTLFNITTKDDYKSPHSGLKSTLAARLKEYSLFQSK
ncbi:uncharacterized protein LOC113215549 [Frankliniella occidentalis]|uniref:Uncharacterized protein LOC113215549 n=1 Tax=Frankliniella occidentalis TaxID=133901 RepID=A0A6J1TJG3_FRAOC|nr:uncharacterized protein LOC113215549 [Frankliniella occidentalis]